jgi:ribA/ribD-fused uncharacterized protein
LILLYWQIKANKMEIEFNSKSASYSELSNFHWAPFTLEDKIWNTVEHYFQAQKFPTDPALQERIRLAKTSLGAKRLGRTKTAAFRSDWETVKDDVMYAGIKAKFQQNPDLATLLKETGTAFLIEKSRSDSYWGSGPNGCGLNKTGRILMKVRLELS